MHGGVQGDHVDGVAVDFADVEVGFYFGDVGRRDVVGGAWEGMSDGCPCCLDLARYGTVLCLWEEVMVYWGMLLSRKNRMEEDRDGMDWTYPTRAVVLWDAAAGSQCQQARE